jgi:hypothetical protein
LRLNFYFCPSYSEFKDEYWLGDNDLSASETDTLLREGAGNGQPTFIDWMRAKVIVVSVPS